MNARMAVLAAGFALCTFPAGADQYRSETRIVTPSETPKSSDQLLKESEGNAYAQSLILQQQAEQAIGKKNYAAAIAKYEQALKLGGLSEIASGDMRYNLAQLYLTLGNNAKAADALETWLKAAGTDGQKPPAEAYAALAAAYIGMKKPREALAPLRRAVELDPQPRREWLQMQFSIHYQQGELQECVKLVKEMLAKFPPDKDTWMQLVALHSKLKQPREAASAMTLAYRQGFLTTPAERVQLAQLLATAGQPYDAAALLEQWLASKEIASDADNTELLAATWLKAREKSRALKAMQQASAMRGKPAQYMEIAQLNLELERWDAAAQALQEAFRRGLPAADRGKAYLALGFAHYMKGDTTAATTAFTAAASQPGSEKNAKAWLSFVQAGIQAEQRARGIFADEGDSPAQTAMSVGAVPFSAAGDAVAPALGGGAGKAETDGMTAIGAVAAGSADGRIPPWTGGLAPTNPDGGGLVTTRVTDPYPGDKPLFVIDASNFAQYRDQLSKGHQALLQRYPSYRLPIYPTRRSASFPAGVYKATLDNQKTAKLIDPDILTGTKLGFPFRIPQTGNEILWNHRVHYRGENLSIKSAQAVVDSQGTYVLNRALTQLYFVYGNLRLPGDLEPGKQLLYYLGRILAPASVAGLTILVHETTDLTLGRQIWAGPPGVRRLFRLPSNLGYDYPLPDAGGMKFVDQINMYNGGFNRYTWKLVGRRPYFAPYNSYRINAPTLRYANLLQPKHFNQEQTRYELHRLWVVEAVTRPKEKHALKRRVFYVDEDSWVILMVDCYDQNDELWRFQEGHGITHYQVPMTTTAPELLYDFRDTRYLASFLGNEEDPPVFNDPKLLPRDFTPSAARNLLR